MKKVIAAIVVAALALVGFLAFQGREKSVQKELYKEAAVFFEEADYKKAIQYFEEAKEHDNLFTGNLSDEILYYQAEAYMKLGETDAAIDIYNRFIEKNPKDSMNYILLGHCIETAPNYEEQQIYEDAYNCYWTAYDQTGDGIFLVQLCNICISMEEYETALEIISGHDSLKDEESLKDLKFLEIVIYEKQQEYGTAYEKALAYCEAYPDDEKGTKEKDFLESRK